MSNLRKLFAGFPTPNYTGVPNDLIDWLLPNFSGAELKIFLFLCRRTFGWCKEIDSISIQQFAEGITSGEHQCSGTGLSEQGVRDGLAGLLKRGYIACTRGGGRGSANAYAIRFNEVAKAKIAAIRQMERVKKVDPLPIENEVLGEAKGSTSDPEWVNFPLATKENTKEITTKENTTSRAHAKSNSTTTQEAEDFSLEDPIEVFCKHGYSRHGGIKLKINGTGAERMIERLHAAEADAGQESFRRAFLRFLGDNSDWLRDNKWPINTFLKQWEQYDSPGLTASPCVPESVSQPATPPEPANASSAPEAQERPIGEVLFERWNAAVLIPELQATWHESMARNPAFNDPALMREFDRLCARVVNGYDHCEDARWLALKHLLRADSRDGAMNWLNLLDRPVPSKDEFPPHIRTDRLIASRKRKAAIAAAATVGEAIVQG